MYSILRAKKLKTCQQITNASRHNLRIRTQSNIDPKRTALNQILFDSLGVDARSPSSLREKLAEFYASLGIKEKKGNVLLYEFVGTASPQFFDGKSGEEIRKWADCQVQFMKSEFGEQVKFAVLHLDERTPHIHCFVSTEMRSVKKYKNRYGVCEKETWSLNAKRYDPDFLMNLQTRFAEANKSWGLRRGVVGSKRRNVPLKEFYRMVDRVMSSSYKKQIDEVIGKVELTLGERLNLETVRDKFRELLLPYMNQLTRQQKAMKEILKLDLHKFQTELIAEQKKLNAERDEISEKRKVYAEAINRDLEQVKLNHELLAKNAALRGELDDMKRKYEPPAETLPSMPRNRQAASSPKLR